MGCAVSPRVVRENQRLKAFNYRPPVSGFRFRPIFAGKQRRESTFMEGESQRAIYGSIGLTKVVHPSKFTELAPCQWGFHPDSHPQKLMIKYTMYP